MHVFKEKVGFTLVCNEREKNAIHHGLTCLLEDVELLVDLGVDKDATPAATSQHAANVKYQALLQEMLESMKE